jgi:hypothetical protein
MRQLPPDIPISGNGQIFFPSLPGTKCRARVTKIKEEGRLVLMPSKHAT